MTRPMKHLYNPDVKKLALQYYIKPNPGYDSIINPNTSNILKNKKKGKKKKPFGVRMQSIL